MKTLRQLNQRLNPLAVALRLLPGRGRLLMLAVAAVVSVLLVTVFGAGLETLEERVGAQGWLMAADDTPEERITIVEIDERSLAEIGPWPWPREDMARLVTALNDADVQLQLHDIVYPEQRDDDDQLLAALQASRGAVIAQVPVLTGDDIRTGVMTHAVTGVSCNADLPVASGYVASHAGLAGVAKGHIAPLVARDGSVRKVPALVCVDGQPYPALVLSALLQTTGALQATGADEWRVTLEAGRGWLAPEYILRLDAYPGLRIPLDEQGGLRISYRDLPQNFLAVSAVDVINGTVPDGLLANSWVLIGGTAFGMGDIVPTPHSGAAPGVELQARLLGSLLDTTMPYTPQSSELLLALLTLLFAAVLFVVAGARERVAAYGLPIAAVLLPLAAVALHWQLLGQLEIWLGWLLPAVYGAVAASLLVLLEQRRIRDERNRVYGNLSSYLPADVARDIAFSLPSSSINARRCDVTLLSADLRNFSAFGEARPPEESAALLHFFFVRSAEIVARHGGRIHEFKGDGLLAVWDGQTTATAQAALAAAQDMQRTIQADMPQHPPAGLEPLALGIGIEQGPALVGSIGPAQRRTHTLLGDTVTITLRIQEMTAELAHPILLGSSVARQLSGQDLESQGSYLLSGLRIPHTLFAPAADSAFGPGIDPPGDETAQRRLRQQQLNLKVVSGGR